jgi:hypothetical protein
MRLPVFKAFGSTFAFVVGNIGEMVRILWLPIALLAAVEWWFWLRCFNSIIGFSHLGPNPTPQEVIPLISAMAIPLVVMFVAAVVLMPMVYAGPLRFLIRGEKPSLPFYLRFGADEGRLLLTYIVIVLINIGIAIAFGIVQMIAVLLLGGPHGPSAGLAVGLISLVRVVVTIWVSLRLSLAYAATIGEREVGVGPSWSVTKSNVWHLLVYWLLWIILLGGVTILVLIPLLPGFISFVSELSSVSHDPEQAKEFVRKMLLTLRDQMHGFGTGVMIAAAIGYVWSLIYHALFVCAGGVAYRLIKES